MAPQVVSGIAQCVLRLRSNDYVHVIASIIIVDSDHKKETQ
jgi:hypothetical protein